jgi:hypothetical protein
VAQAVEHLLYKHKPQLQTPVPQKQKTKQKKKQNWTNKRLLELISLEIWRETGTCRKKQNPSFCLLETAPHVYKVVGSLNMNFLVNC